MRKSALQAWRDEVNETGRRMFAEANGLKDSPRSFTVEALARGQRSGGKRRFFQEDDSLGRFDHAEYYKSPEPPHPAVCLVAHVYRTVDQVREDCSKWAKEQGLVAHVLPDQLDSWYYPRGTTTVAYTRPGMEIVWPNWREAVPVEPVVSVT